MRNNIRRAVIAAMGLLWGGLTACGPDLGASSTAQTSQALGPDTRTKLHVPIYPWIPDPNHDSLAGMAARIEAEFMAENPDVALDVNPSCFNHDFYNVPAVIGSLNGEYPGCPVDVIETDQIFLGEVAASGAIQPWPELPPRRWHPASLEASTYDGEVYGVPHWMCTHFVFSRNAKVAAAGSASELVAALDKVGGDPKLTGHILGDWTLDPMYFDAWADSYGPSNVSAAVSGTEVDAAVVSSMRSVFAECNTATGNHCLDGTWERWPATYNTPAERFVSGQAAATLGYLDQLYTFLDMLPAGSTLQGEGIEFNTLQLGNGNETLLFTDSFLLSSKCNGACKDAAQRFANYMSRTRTMEWMLASGDVPEATRIPRYGLVADLDVYQAPSIIGDRYIQKADRITRSARSMPNHGVSPVKAPLYEMILSGISQ